MRTPDPTEIHQLPIEDQLPAFIDQHRDMLALLLEGLTDEEARRALVPSKTTLLGLVKHVTFVEQVWLGEAVTGRSRAELGIAAGPDESFDLDPHDTIESVLADHQRAVAQSRDAVATLGPDDTLPGNRRGPLPLRWVLLHVLRELAQHCGHGEILREQILANRERDRWVQQWADEAEAGYEVEELKRRGRGHPGGGTEPMP